MSHLALTAGEYLNLDKVNNLKEAIHIQSKQQQQVNKLKESIHQTVEGYENYEQDSKGYATPYPQSVNFTQPKIQNTNWNQQPVQEYGYRIGNHQQYQDIDKVDNAVMMKKINYIIKMLEDEKDNKNDSTTENIIMFALIGVFTIFTIDSFVRVGKYVR
jgi:hypothetical protein